MKYIAVLDTDEIEDFEFFEDGAGKYLHAIDANAKNGEWIYLLFKPLEQDTVIDKIRAEIEQARKYYEASMDYTDGAKEQELGWVLELIDKYKKGEE